LSRHPTPGFFSARHLLLFLFIASKLVTFSPFSFPPPLCLSFLPSNHSPFTFFQEIISRWFHTLVFYPVMERSPSSASFAFLLKNRSPPPLCTLLHRLTLHEPPIVGRAQFQWVFIRLFLCLSKSAMFSFPGTSRLFQGFSRLAVCREFRSFAFPANYRFSLVLLPFSCAPPPAFLIRISCASFTRSQPPPPPPPPPPPSI